MMLYLFMEDCCHGDALFAMKQEAVFERLGMLQNSRKLAHTSERLKTDIWCLCQDSVWQNDFNKAALAVRFTEMYKTG